MKNSIHNKAIAVIIVAAMNTTVYNDKQSSNLPLYFQIAPFIQGIFYASTYTAWQSLIRRMAQDVGIV